MTATHSERPQATVLMSGEGRTLATQGVTMDFKVTQEASVKVGEQRPTRCRLSLPGRESEAGRASTCPVPCPWLLLLRQRLSLCCGSARIVASHRQAANRGMREGG